jgi:hypothetical protein
MAIKTKPLVVCSVCDKRHSLTVSGYVHPHGPVRNRCLGSWQRPLRTEAQQEPPGV